jgi:hypothetical protein
MRPHIVTTAAFSISLARLLPYGSIVSIAISPTEKRRHIDSLRNPRGMPFAPVPVCDAV